MKTPANMCHTILATRYLQTLKTGTRQLEFFKTLQYVAVFSSRDHDRKGLKNLRAC